MLKFVVVFLLLKIAKKTAHWAIFYEFFLCHCLKDAPARNFFESKYTTLKNCKKLSFYQFTLNVIHIIKLRLCLSSSESCEENNLLQKFVWIFLCPYDASARHFFQSTTVKNCKNFSFQQLILTFTHIIDQDFIFFVLKTAKKMAYWRIFYKFFLCHCWNDASARHFLESTYTT